MYLITYGNPITGTKHTCVWLPMSFRKVGRGAREIQDMCEKLGIKWKVY